MKIKKENGMYVVVADALSNGPTKEWSICWFKTRKAAEKFIEQCKRDEDERMRHFYNGGQP